MREIKFIAQAAFLIMCIYCIYSCVSIEPCMYKFTNEHPNYSVEDLEGVCEK